METNNEIMTPEVETVNANNGSLIQKAGTIGGIVALVGFILVPTFKWTKSKIMSKKVELKVVEDEED